MRQDALFECKGKSGTSYMHPVIKIVSLIAGIDTTKDAKSSWKWIGVI